MSGNLLTLAELPFHLKQRKMNGLIGFNNIIEFMEFQVKDIKDDNYGLWYLNRIIQKDVITENYREIKDLLLPEEFDKLLNLTEDEIYEINSRYDFIEDVTEIINNKGSRNQYIKFENMMNFFFIHKNTMLYDICQQYGITLEHMIDNTYYTKNYYGNGYFGVVYKEGDRICKITLDSGEYTKSKIIQNSSYELRKYFPNISGTVRLGRLDSGIYSFSHPECYIINKEFIEGSMMMDGEVLENYFDERILAKFDKLVDREIIKKGVRELDLHSGNCVIFPVDSDVPFKFFDY